jgi:hypothetical protein
VCLSVCYAEIWVTDNAQEPYQDAVTVSGKESFFHAIFQSLNYEGKRFAACTKGGKKILKYSSKLNL